MHRKITAAFAGALMLATATFALPAQAASLTTSQVQAVISLLQAFGVDSTTIASVQSTLTGNTVSTTPTTASSTALSASMIGFLHMGDRGDAVKLLQTILAADPGVYPQGTVSGFFGLLTQQALMNYQKKHGLDQVGFIGPKTLRELDGDLDDNPLGTESNGQATSTITFGEGRHFCAIVPPGHLIAPGWLKHHDGERPEIPECQTLPPGIEDHGGHGTTTPPTADTTAPVLSSIAVGSITPSGAIVTWATNENATSQVDFGTTTSYGTGITASAGLAHSVSLTGLLASTPYHFRVTSADASGNTATSSDMTFTTSATPDTTPPVISGASIGSVSSTTATVSWTTNENATSKVYFGTTTPLVLAGALTVSSGAFTTTHSLALSPLTASTTYYYVIESADASSNTATTSEANFLTTN